MVTRCVDTVTVATKAHKEPSRRFYNHGEGPLLGLLLVEVESVLSHLRHYAQHYPTEGRCEVGSPTQRSGPRSEGSFPALVSRSGVQQQSNKRYQEDRSVSPDTQQGKKQPGTRRTGKKRSLPLENIHTRTRTNWDIK